MLHFDFVSTFREGPGTAGSTGAPAAWLLHT